MTSKLMLSVTNILKYKRVKAHSASFLVIIYKTQDKSPVVTRYTAPPPPPPVVHQAPARHPPTWTTVAQQRHESIPLARKPAIVEESGDVQFTCKVSDLAQIMSIVWLLSSNNVS